MELEARVQALEQELQILKNQIQATLLDIQTQLLTNAYPSLRTEETQPTTHANPIYHRVKPEPEIEVEEEKTETIASTKVRKVSLDQVREKSNDKSAPPIVQQHEAEMDWEAVNEWEKWASSKVKEIGVKRTQTLIDMYAQNGRFNRQVADILLQVVGLYEEEIVIPPQNGNSRPQSTPISQPRAAAPRQTVPVTKSQPVANVKSSSVMKQSTENAKPATSPKPQPAIKARPASRPQVATTPVQQPTATQPRAKATTTTQPGVPQKKQVKPKAPTQASENDEESRTLILRLMAGIQNAGAGVKRGNKRG